MFWNRGITSLRERENPVCVATGKIHVEKMGNPVRFGTWEVHAFERVRYAVSCHCGVL